MDGVILCNNRTFIPSPLRALILDTLHSVHQGVSCMTSRAASVFWPGITPAIANLRARCRSCNERAPSQPHVPPLAAQEPVYFFSASVRITSNTRAALTWWLWTAILVGRLCSNHEMVSRACKMSTRNFRYIRHCRRTIVRWRTKIHGRGDTTTVVKLGCPSPPLICCTSPLKWSRRARGQDLQAHAHGQHCLNSEINLDKVQRGMLQCRNTPDRDTGLSPAQMIFGRPIKDFIPILPGSYRPHNTWIETSRAREEARRARNVRNAERLTEHTVRLQPLKVGDRVFIQNQTGNHPLRWDRTG